MLMHARNTQVPKGGESAGSRLIDGRNVPPGGMSGSRACACELVNRELCD